MAEIRVHLDTSLPVDSVLGAATEFSQERLELWPTIDPAVYSVETIDDQFAIVKEGTDVLGGIWAKERYDWSRPGIVRATVQDSNIFRTGSTWEMRVQPADGSGSHVEIVWNRQGKGLKGRFVVLMMRLTGRGRLERGLRETLAVVERKRQPGEAKG
jgi:hypothetical protein